MQTPSFDPGLTNQFTGALSRVINKDGSFNVRRLGETWHDFHPYLHLINMSWSGFLVTLFSAYMAVNILFACAYYAIGPGQLTGAEAASEPQRFLHGFFFSTHTLSTVGYGSLAPKGTGANILASLESMIGVLAFAVATGLLYGRVSRPSARFGFSPHMVVAPYQDGDSLQFRVVNRRQNSLMELEAQIMLMTVQAEGGRLQRHYEVLKLERRQVMFLALTWTVVHPIDRDSPLWGKTAADLEALQAEVMILMKAYDDTFSQTVAARHSYRHDEIVWGKRFAPAFHVDPAGDLVLEVRKVGELA
jgi:inward rectifier potassium channel